MTNWLLPLRLCLAVMLLTGTFMVFAGQAGENQPKADQASNANHTKFEELKQEFTTAPDVTKACLSCQTETSKHIHNTTHCHIGYGWKGVCRNSPASTCQETTAANYLI